MKPYHQRILIVKACNFQHKVHINKSYTFIKVLRRTSVMFSCPQCMKISIWKLHLLIFLLNFYKTISMHLKLSKWGNYALWKVSIMIMPSLIFFIFDLKIQVECLKCNKQRKQKNTKLSIIPQLAIKTEYRFKHFL